MRLFLTEREKYVRERLRAIEAVRPDTFNQSRLSSRTNALRCIKRFESINGIPFDYKDIRHLCRCASGGHHEHFFRATKRLFKSWGKYKAKILND